MKRTRRRAGVKEAKGVEDGAPQFIEIAAGVPVKGKALDLGGGP